jgi:hypothetical protein
MTGKVHKPLGLSISPQAALELAKFLRTYKTDEPAGTFIVGLCWATRSIGGGGGSGGPGVGIMRRSQAQDGEIERIGDIEVALGMSEQDAAKFTDKELDFVGRSFVLLNR